ncbi:MAG TPA: hypothetical protein PKW90_14795, partial [Myxococcota bacterium]|nr:hypothetical protein [Myxococcota bacterium]
MLFTLCDARLFNAITTYDSGSTNFDDYVISGPELACLGPFLQDLVVHVDSTGLTNKFTFDVQLQYRYNGAWKSVELLPLKSTEDYFIGSAVTDRTKFGKEIRVVLRTQIATGG